MKEVSCGVFAIFQQPLQRKGVPLHAMVKGTTVPVALLRQKKERIDWTDFVRIMRNLREHFTDEEFVEMGRQYMHSPALRFGFVVARLLFGPMDFYRWMNKPREGLGNQMFTCIVPHHREPGPNEIEMDLIVADGYEVCWEFFIVSSGNMEELPRLLGLPRAEVRLTRIPRGGRFHIKVPAQTPVLTRAWRVASWPLTVKAAARELKEAHENLLDRYEEIETARAQLDRQATKLRTAHAISDLINRDLDLALTIERIARALVDEAGFVHARIRLDGREPALVAAYGEPSDQVAIRRGLHGRDAQPIGELSVIPSLDAERDEREELLTFIEPTLAMAVQNALAYRELGEYKAGLERLVDERTTELRQARDQLSRTVEQLRDAQSAREMFFGNISHEIRTPLSLILLAAGDIERRAGHLLDDRGREGLAVVTDATRKLVRLVDELLLLAAGQEDKLTIAPEPVDLAALLGQVVAAWRPAAERAGLELSGRVPESLLVQIDPVAIERVASNLMSNAVKYTPSGRIELELVDDATTGAIRLSVLDTGPGIAPELAGRLFGRFERGAGESRRTSGTGIGLALVKQLVEAHGGTVAAHARAHGGTEMRVELPRSLALHARAERATIAPPTLRATHPTLAPSVLASGSVLTPEGTSAGIVLITEDEPRLAESIARLLAHRYTALIAHDGTTALELVKKYQPQLLITDVDMPGMSGLELAARFREATGDRLAPIVILSALVDLRTRVAGLEAGAVDYVAKPFDPTELVARVESHFRMRDLAMRLHRAEHLSALGIMTSGLAHELRNPANGIVNAIEPLTRLLPPELVTAEAPAGQLLEVMTACAEQIGFLSRQLLGFRDATTLELRAALLPDLVQRAVMLARRSLAGVELRTDLGQTATVMCAPPLLVQVLANLVENAAQAAGRGGWVEVRASEAEQAVAVEIADSGPGVPPELRERVFEPFFTTKPSGKGTGLGLAVARAIVHRHGGTLDIRVRGDHSVFVMELPRDKAPIRTANAV